MCVQSILEPRFFRGLVNAFIQNIFYSMLVVFQALCREMGVIAVLTNCTVESSGSQLWDASEPSGRLVT